MKNIDIGIFVQNLKNIMKEKGINNLDLARMTGISYQRICRLLSGTTKKFPATDVMSICNSLEVEPAAMNEGIMEISGIKKLPKKKEPAEHLIDDMIKKLHTSISDQSIEVQKEKDEYLIPITKMATLHLALLEEDGGNMCSLSIKIRDKTEELIFEQNNKELNQLWNECEQYIKDTRISDSARTEIKSFIWGML